MAIAPDTLSVGAPPDEALALLERQRTASSKPFTRQRAAAALAAMSPADRARYATLTASASPNEKVLVERAVAMGHPMAEVLGLSRDLRRVASGNYAQAGLKDPGLCRYLDGLAPEERMLAVATLDAEQQAFDNSCNPTSGQIIVGELDPLYSLRAHQDPKRLAAEQDAFLREHTAAHVGGVTEASDASSAQGADLDPFLARHLAGAGYRFEFLRADAQNLHSTADSRRQATDAIYRQVAAGLPANLQVQWISPQDRRAGGHFLAALDARTLPDGRRQLLIQDPQTPHLDAQNHRLARVWVDVDDLNASTLGAANKRYRNQGELIGFSRARLG